MEKKKTFRQLIGEGQVIVPGIFDCISARAVELVGYEGAYLSSAGVSYSWCGVPDIGLVNEDEMLWVASRISDYIPLPLLVSVENGYSSSPTGTYRAVSRLKKGGADSFIIDDTSDYRGNDRERVEAVSADVWISKIKAACKAVEGSDSLIIARTWVKETQGLKAAVERCKMAQAAGASMAAITGLETNEEATCLSDAVSIPKMWMNPGAAKTGQEVDPDRLKEMGYRLITISYTEKGAMFGMLDFAGQNNRRGDTVYHDQHDFEGLLKPGQDYHELFSFHKKWIPMEQYFMDVRDLASRQCVVKEDGGCE